MKKTPITMSSHTDLSVLKESFSGTDDGQWAFYLGTTARTWRAQTFQASGNYTLTKIKLTLLKVSGHADGVMTFSIKATSSGLPVGADLASGTINASAIGTAKAQIEIEMSNLALTSGTTYAIIMRSNDNDNTKPVYARYVAAGGYANGAAYVSADPPGTNGETWVIASTNDFLFEVWGF